MTWFELFIIALAIALFGVTVIGVFFIGLFLGANGWG